MTEVQHPVAKLCRRGHPAIRNVKLKKLVQNYFHLPCPFDSSPADSRPEGLLPEPVFKMSSILSRVSSCLWNASTVGKKSSSGPGLQKCVVMKIHHFQEHKFNQKSRSRKLNLCLTDVCFEYLGGSLPGVRAPRLPVEPCRSGFFGTQNFPT